MTELTVGKIFRVLYDSLLGCAFLLTWISPFALGRDAHEWLGDVLIMQIVLIGLTALLLYKFDIGQLSGLTIAVVIGAVALVAALNEGTLDSFGLFVPVAWHGYNLYALKNSSMPTIERRMQETFAFWSVVFMAAAGMIAVTLPLPMFGWGHLSSPAPHTHTLMAFGALYFISIAFLKHQWRVGWPVPSFRQIRRASAP